MNFGQYVKSLRTAANLSQRALAERLGLSHVYLGEVERGKRTALLPFRWPALVEIGADPDELSRLYLAARAPRGIVLATTRGLR